MCTLACVLLLWWWCAGGQASLEDQLQEATAGAARSQEALSLASSEEKEKEASKAASKAAEAEVRKAPPRREQCDIDWVLID